MSKKHYILKFKLLSFRVLCFAALNLAYGFFNNINAQSISVFAGNDQIICSSDTLSLNILNATITGAVSNGYWFTSGDGIFLPTQQYNRFSITTKYIPGQLDIAAGFVNLILASDDPDGVGPMVQVTDQVKITFMGNISIVCNNNLNISLGPDCTQLVTPSMLVANIQQPLNYYKLTIKNQYNQPITNNVLTNEHIGKVLEYSIGHKCGSNSCWGYVNVKDKLPPPLFCKDKTVLCGINTTADSIGLPIPTAAKAKKIAPKKYRVTGLDACGPATLSFEDAYVQYNCDNALQGKITRTWTAVDSFGNSATCVQMISIKNKSLSQVILPRNFDGTTKPSFECNGIWPKLPNGHPSLDTTGMPNTSGCANLESTFIDTRFDQCGASYNILRKWTIINWCGTLTMEHNQLINVKDSKAPIFDCPSPIELKAGAYVCANDIDTLPYPKNIVDCSKTSLRVNIYDKFSSEDFSYLVYKIANGKSLVSNLPVGDYVADYIMTDACGNSDTCSSNIFVKDRNVPIAVCNQFLKISLGPNGSARLNAQSIDDGSFDNCQIASLKVAKMRDTCSNQSITFNDYVDFCCLEANKSIMTILRVTDNFGNSNSCMVEVKVQDKIAPTINCPSNLTISCKNDIDTSKLSVFGSIAIGVNNVTPIIIFDAYNNGNAGQNGFYTDNCIAKITASFVDNTQCKQGTIVRTFVVTDGNNNSNSCTQTILVKDPMPFTINNIVWPNSTVEINGCDESDANLQVTGKPTFLNVNCATVAAAFEDKKFYGVDGACVKILREWTVVDWCQYNPNTNSGKWTRNQTIKINNATPPTFYGDCSDQIMCLYTEDCKSDLFIFEPLFSDDCTPVENIKSSWKVDVNNDGIFDSFGITTVVKVALPVGKHKVTYSVFDACANEAKCSFIVTTKDCKKPSPYCHTQLNSTVMPSSGTLSIKAKSFDLGSYDNCTSKDKLKFSFTQNEKDSVRLITCADLKNGVSDTVSIRMWVIDSEGNKDYCDVDFYIEDHNDVCEDKNPTGMISGIIFAADKVKRIGNVTVNYKVSEGNYSASNRSNIIGEFNAGGFPINLPVVVKPVKNDSLTEGLSTLDLILIQKHILGATKFTDSYKMIAADADGNKKVSVADLVAIRKIILGASSNLPKNRNAYTFVDANHKFSDVINSYNFPDSILLTNLQKGENKNINFVAVKIGDVNNSIGNITLDDQLENRNASENIIVSRVGEYVQFSFEKDQAISGLQLAFDIENVDDIIFNKKIGEFDYNFENGLLKIVLHNLISKNIIANEFLFKVKTNDFDIQLENKFSEIYNAELEIIKVRLQNQAIEKVQNMIFPIDVFESGDEIVIQSKVDIESVDIMISDVLGRLLLNRKMSLLIGENRFKIYEKSQLKILTIKAGNLISSFKIINH